MRQIRDGRAAASAAASLLGVYILSPSDFEGKRYQSLLITYIGTSSDICASGRK